MIEWMDDFTSYGTDLANNAARLLNGPYADNGRTDLQADPDPSAGGKMVLRKIGGGLGGDCRRVLSGTQTTVGVAARWWLNILPANNGQGEAIRFVSFRDVNNLEHLNISCDPSGNINIYRQDQGVAYPGTLLGATANPVVITNAWRHIETKVVFDNVSGSVEVRLEGVTVLRVTGVRTNSNQTGAVAGCSQIAFTSPYDSGGPTQYIKDFILWNGQGTVNNDFFGSCQVYKLQPASDVSRNWGTQQSAVPSLNAPVGSTTGGTLAAATYYYVVTALYSTGESIACNEVSVTTTGTTSSVALSWIAPPGMNVTGYRIYRGTATGAENTYYAPAGTGTSFTDTGAAGTAGTPPADTGTGWDKINDTTPDDDAKFIQAGTGPIPAAYVAALTQLPVNVTTVKGVMILQRSRKTDGGDAQVQASLVSGANTGNGSNRTITTAYTYWADVFDQDPSGVSWNKTLVNALNLKLNRTL